MPVIETRTDTDDLTLTVVTEIDAAPERAWQLWADRSQLDRWWGPLEWPATFHRHELEPGGECRYYMTGPDGSRSHGWFTIVETAAPNRLVFRDGFADENGEPTDPEDYATVTVTIEPVGERTRMSVQTKFRSAEQLTQMIEMGMAEGMTEAMGQIDGILAA